MAKTNQAKNQTIREHTPGAHDKPPHATSGERKPVGTAGYKKVEDERFEVSGFWLPEAGAINGVLVGGYEFIQKSGVNAGGTSRVLVLKLIAPCAARVKLEGGGFDETELAAGELCGVFYSAGLRDLLGYAGCKVLVTRNTEKKPTRKGAMWTYDMSYDGVKKPLVIRPPFKGQDDDTSFDPSSFNDAPSFSE